MENESNIIDVFPFLRFTMRSEITQLLEATAAGDSAATARLLETVYAELRSMAAGQMAREAAGHTLNATALVHEAYLRLGIGNPGTHWENRRHFFASAAEAMRRILIDQARSRRAVRRGGTRQRVPLGDASQILASPDHLLDLDDVLTRFAAEQPKKSELVKLRFFAGLTMPETAEMLEISLATAERWWAFARAWLYAELAEDSRETA